MTELMDKVRAAQAKYEALSEGQKALHDYEQRRSFVRGMCPDNKDIKEWSKMVDRVLPPHVPPGVPLDWLIANLMVIANTGQSIEPDHWKFRCMARETAQKIINRLRAGE
jgi:hypothetical protein